MPNQSVEIKSLERIEIKPNSMNDDFGREAMTTVGDLELHISALCHIDTIDFILSR
jgi:hypothetical protein